MRPLISVITVCYQALNELKLTVNSFFEQNFSDVEYIVIDGGSCDGSREYLESIQQRFPPGILRWRSQKDGGVFDAMNAGVELAAGQWLIFMNAGDCFFASSTLTQVKSLLPGENAGVFYGDTLMCYHWGKMIQCDDEQENHDPIMPFIHQSVFVRRELLVKYPFDLRYHVLADLDLFYKLRRENIVFIHYPIIISRYNAADGISATSPLKIALERAKIFGQDQHPLWLFRKMLIFIRVGLFQLLKIILPNSCVYALQRWRRRYMRFAE